MNNAPFRVGQRVVCIDDSPGRIIPDKSLTKGAIYIVYSVIDWGPQGWDIRVDPNDQSWDAGRFAPIDPYENISSEIAGWEIVEEREDRILETVKN